MDGRGARDGGGRWWVMAGGDLETGGAGLRDGGEEPGGQ